MQVIRTETVDKKAIDQAIKQLEANKKYCQKLVDMFSAIKISIQIEDLQSLSGWANNGGGQYIDELMRKRALEMPVNEHLKGMSPHVINKEISMPAYSEIVLWLRKNPYEGKMNTAIDTTNLEIKKNKVVISDHANENIKNQHTKLSIVPDYDAINKVSNN